MTNTRMSDRIPLSAKVRYRSESLNRFVEQESVDVARGGLFIKSERPLGIGALLKFEMQVPEDEARVAGVGKVVWRRLPDPAQTIPSGMGIKFVKLEPGSHALVEHITQRHAAAGVVSSRSTEAASPLARSQSGDDPAKRLAPATSVVGAASESAASSSESAVLPSAWLMPEARAAGHEVFAHPASIRDVSASRRRAPAKRGSLLWLVIGALALGGAAYFAFGYQASPTKNPPELSRTLD